MSHGKAAARDIVYGRRGGRWAEPEPAPAAEPEQPKTPPADPPCKICEKLYGKPRPYSAHVKPCRFCGRDQLHHADGDADIELQARARMATARRDAGLTLSELDRWALDEWGDQDLGKVRP